ncbi:ABC transporter ATP-binding protein [Pseudoduganella violaceinigra]|uniref:ABC transporter ATP-binding protein n=1 Tax=Pseudoduganella violaceinigra TaxID=246602 RepID=UPI0004125E2A|nr:ABC transporter transmembrane domain-containing protein [Pseudoduganella violaceinigra]
MMRPFAWRMTAGVLFMALAVAVQLAYPKALAYFIDNIGKRHASEWYAGFFLAVLGILVLQAIATTLRYYLFESTGYMIVTRIRRLVYAALLRQPIAFYDKHHVGELTSRLAADVEQLHDTLSMGLAITLRCLCIVAGAIIMLLAISPPLCLVLLGYAPLSILLGNWAGTRLAGRARDIQRTQAACGKVAHEHFANIRLVRAFGQYLGAVARYEEATGQALRTAVNSTRLFGLYRGASSFLTYFALLLALWYGARLIGQGALSIGELTAFVVYAAMATESASMINDFWADWVRTLGATERLFEIMDSAPQPEPEPAAAAPDGQITFDRVSFRYPERPQQLALDNASFSVDAGKTIALVGASGAGKSTIANLLLGFYEPQEGRLLFDGRQLAPHEARAGIAIVEQEPALFSGTIHENIAFALPGRAATRDEVTAAAHLAHAHGFIAAFPQGYETVVGERGVQLSGGQKQRIAIARALLRNPAILILDEATSALDAASEMQVQAALERLMDGRTTIIIAHRYSTVVKADRILVMQEGRIVQQGRHEELLRDHEGLYHHLMQHQLSQYRNIASAA